MKLAIYSLLVLCIVTLGLLDYQGAKIESLQKQVVMLQARMNDMEKHNHQPFHINPKREVEG